MATEFKKLNELDIKASVDLANDYAVINNGTSTYQMQMQKIINAAKTETLSAVEAAYLDMLTDGCFIMYHRAVEATDNYPIARKASEWTAKQNAGEIADGVLVVCGDKHVVVAPTGSGAIHWGSVGTLVASSGNYSSDREWAMKHFDGKARTAAIVAHSAYAGDGVDYAPGFAHAYSHSNKNGRGLTAGRWWLPSMGELAMIWQNKQKINACLALITGAQQLAEGGHWSSSEPSAAYAWHLNLSSGHLYALNKVDGSCNVRPVSAFLN